METQFAIARAEDYEEVIDLANYVFSQAHAPHDFPVLLPKLYKRDYFMDGIHYLAKEGGRIKAAIGAYPLTWEFPGALLPGRGIGMVSVHPYYRSRGYMKVLMNLALEDMKRDGMVFSCLGGQRQRYAYFGYTPAGTAYTFTCCEANILHTLGRGWTTDLSLKLVNSDDTALLDCIYALHEAKRARLRRNRERLFAMLSSWNAQIFAVIKAGCFKGYFLYKNNQISEINMEDPSCLAEVTGLFLRRPQEAHQQDSVQITAGPHEIEKLAVLSRFAEECNQSSAYQFRVFDYLRFTDPFLKLKSQMQPLQDGSFVLQIEGGLRLCLSVCNGAAEVYETNAAPDLTLDSLEALRFLYDPLGAMTIPALREHSFLQNLLPLPLFFESPDQV